MSTKFNQHQEAFISKAREVHAVNSTEVLVLERDQITDLAKLHGLKNPMWLKSASYRVGRGTYSVPSLTDSPTVAVKPVTEAVATAVSPAPVPVAQPEIATSTAEVAYQAFPEHAVVEDIVNYTPAKNPLFVKFGNFADINKIVKSKRFHPVFITGLSGNGKTFSIEQACALNKREYIPVSITVETDESDLIGDLTLKNGNIEWVDGPVVTAMKRGAVLLLDEIDLASNKIMSLQSIVDGKGVFLKKIKKHIIPAKGFQIFATANTKGKGSEDGRFIGTNIMNEAFLERFKNTFEQDYPTPAVEKKILGAVFSDLELDDVEFIDKLTAWADIIRKSFKEGAIDEIITTRRLVHIAETYAIFEDRLDSIEKCTNRFDDAVKESFLELYTNIDETIRANEELENANSPEYLQSVVDEAQGKERIPY